MDSTFFDNFFSGLGSAATDLSNTALSSATYAGSSAIQNIIGGNQAPAPAKPSSIVSSGAGKGALLILGLLLVGGAYMLWRH